MYFYRKILREAIILIYFYQINNWEPIPKQLYFKLLTSIEVNKIKDKKNYKKRVILLIK